MKLLGIISQYWRVIFKNRYEMPSIYVWGYWSYKWDKDGNIIYDQKKTLENYINGIKEQPWK